MQPTQPPDEYLSQQEVRRLTSEALAGRRFPPVLQYPEAKRGDFLLSTLFTWPIIVWVPECINRSQKPFCVMPGCSCTPRLKEYKQRVVEEVDTKCRFLYIKYQCSGDSKGCFSTVTPAYLQREAQLLMHFPYVLTKKFGLSKEMMELVHEGMLSPNGLSSTVENIKRRREKRYYKLLCLFANQIQNHRLSNPVYLAPSPPSAPQYSAKQSPLGPETLSAAWLQTSRIYSSLCEQIMRCTKVKRALRMDHPVKFCKRLKVWPGGTGKRESMKDAKMLLLLQNEIGQIVGRRHTRSENNDETCALLEHVKKHAILDEEVASQCFIISDNANAVRNMVNNVFGGSVGVRQDPFHVIQRFTEKVKDKPTKKRLAKQLHEALYTIDESLRVPSEMATQVRKAVSSVSFNDINCSEQDWRGSLNSNLAQISQGDLYVESNSYDEGGGKSVRVLSTSQLEGFHSALKKLLARSVSAEVGLRILDVFIVRHNLKVGLKYGRNPPLEHADLVTLAQTASLCRGTIPESPQLEFVSKLLSAPLPPPQYRSTTEHDFVFEQWGQLFETARVDTAALELNLHRAHEHRTSIKELLSKQAVFSSTSRLPKADFFNSLCLTELEYEAAVGFSAEELALLKQLRSEQARSGESWAECTLVTTIMYNIVVTSNSNKQLELRRRSFATLAAKVDGLSKRETGAQSKSSPASARELFQFATEDSTCDDLTGYEQAFQIDLFRALRELNGLKKKRQVFVQIYDFASCVCSGIHRKSTAHLLARWENMKRASNRGASLKIKLKLPPELIATMREQSTGGALSSKAPAQRTLTDANDVDEDNAIHQFCGVDIAVQSATSDLTLTPTTARRSPLLVGGDANVQPLPSSSNSIHTSSAKQCSNPYPANQSHTSTLPATSNSPSKIMEVASVGASRPTSSPHVPTFITQEHIDELRKLEGELPNRSGKWSRIYREYTELYPDPDSRISLNALRCRLRPPTAPRQKANAVDPAQLSSVTTTPRKRKETSCASCHQRKKRCGDWSVNPHCMRASNTSADKSTFFHCNRVFLSSQHTCDVAPLSS